MNEFTVLASVENDGELKVFHAIATDAFHAFSVVAEREKNGQSLDFLAAFPGTLSEGKDFYFPGEGIVCMETVLEQPDVFGPSGGSNEEVGISTLEAQYVDASYELLAKQRGLGNQEPEMSNFIRLRDALRSHSDFTGILPKTHYSGGDLDPDGVDGAGSDGNEIGSPSP